MEFVLGKMGASSGLILDVTAHGGVQENVTAQGGLKENDSTCKSLEYGTHALT